MQINYNPNNKMRISLLKREWDKLRINEEGVENLEREINELENTQNEIPIQDPYHPDNAYYLNRKWWLEQIRDIVRIIRMWIIFFHKT